MLICYKLTIAKDYILMNENLRKVIIAKYLFLIDFFSKKTFIARFFI